MRPRFMNHRVHRPAQSLPLGLCLAIAIALSFSNAGAEDPWPKFRGPSGDGKAALGTSLPVQWSTDRDILWRTELPGEGWSSPVVGSDAIYVTAAIPKEPSTDGETRNEASEMTLELLKIDPETGALLQRTSIFQQGPDAPGIHSKNSHASPTLWLDNDRLFAHFGHQGTALLTRGGKVVWENRELTFPPVHGNGGSPALVGDALIFTCDGAEEGYVAALEASTGKLLWRTNRPVDAPRKFSFCTPTAIEVDGKIQVICPGSDCVLALDPTDGRIIWQVTYDGYSVVPKPVYADGLVFVATGFGPTAIMAIDPSGTGDVTGTHVVWTMDRGAPKTPSLLADKGLLYVTSDDGIFTVLETKTGDQVYKQRIGGKYSASPIMSGDRIYLTSEEGDVRVLRAGREFELLAENKMDERALATPAVLGNSIILRTQSALYRIGK